MKVGQQVWYQPRQPDAFQGFSHPSETVGTVLDTGADWILVKPCFSKAAWLEETISVNQFKEKGVRVYGAR